MHSTAGMETNLINHSQALCIKSQNASFIKIQTTMEAYQYILQLNIQIYKCTFNKYNMTYS